MQTKYLILMQIINLCSVTLIKNWPICFQFDIKYISVDQWQIKN